MKMSFKKSTLIIVALVLCTFSSASSLFAALSVLITPSSDQIVLKGESVSFSCSPSGGCTPYTYDWSFQNATPSSSASQSSVATFGAAAEGNENTVTVTVTDSSPTAQTVSANIVVRVPKITTQTVFTSPSDRSRKKLGIGEKVELTTTPSSIGTVNWTITGGGSLSSATGTITTFTAGETASSASKATATFSNGKKIDVTFNVVEPSGVKMEASSNLSTKNPLTAGFIADVYYLPADVNFGKIQVYEGVCTSVTTGYFDVVPYKGIVHPLGNPTPMSGHVEGKGTKDSAQDTVSTTANTTPYSNGAFQWPIPWYYKLGGTDKFMITITHNASLSVNAGTATLTTSKAAESKTETNP